jgi:uncharacterized protein DUF6455
MLCLLRPDSLDRISNTGPHMKHFKPTEHRAAMMEAMSEIAGVNWSEAIASDPKMDMAFHSAQRSCAQCEREGDCLAWLATNPAAGQAADFCRNQSLLQVLRRLEEQAADQDGDRSAEQGKTNAENKTAE